MLSEKDRNVSPILQAQRGGLDGKEDAEDTSRIQSTTKMRVSPHFQFKCDVQAGPYYFIDGMFMRFQSVSGASMTPIKNRWPSSKTLSAWNKTVRSVRSNIRLARQASLQRICELMTPVSRTAVTHAIHSVDI